MFLSISDGEQKDRAATSTDAEALDMAASALPLGGLPGLRPEDGELLQVSEKTAMEVNAGRPYSKLHTHPAKPFHSTLTDDNLERALNCLAIAALYEAGGDPDDQKPVMQVILNRVRHPAFPNTVCGVVSQGSERKTGCQFTFTCDGSLGRWSPSAANLAQARELARSMLADTIDRRVGLATHYHTNWVVPYWSSSLEKITGVETHLFFRWPGHWGQPKAFHTKPAADEPPFAALSGFAQAHKPHDPTSPVEVEIDNSLASTFTSVDQGDDLQSETSIERFVPRVIKLSEGGSPGRWALAAVAECGARPECRVVGWADAQSAPTILNPSTIAASPPDFVYVQVLRNRVQQAYWDCGKWPRATTARCLGSPQAVAELAVGGG